MLLTLAGGIGLFLLGIHMLTDGIRSVSGDRLRQVLRRFAATRIKAFAAGLGVTAVIQSANATILMTMGFQAAGLVGLSETLAVAIGAHVGTTSTAWIVAGSGLSFSLAPAAMAAVLVGAVLRIATRGGWRAAGTASAGFGLLLLGISFMQDGMGGLAPDLRQAVPDNGVASTLMLLGIGALATVVAQSSSVAIAATLTAAAAGGLDLEAAALLVIGHNLGTAVPVFLASFGAGPTGRRVAVAHGATTGVTVALALLLLAPFLWLSQHVAEQFGAGAAITLATFHTILNVVGAAVLLPLTGILAAVTVRWVPEKGPALARSLDPLTSKMPAAAVTAARSGVAEVAREAMGIVRSRVLHGVLARGTERRLEAAESAWDRVRAFLARVDPAGRKDPLYGDVVRAMDHLEGLLEDCWTSDLRAAAFQAGGVRVCTVRFQEGLAAAAEWMAAGLEGPPEEALDDFGTLRTMVDEHRTKVMTDTTLGKEDLVAALAQLDVLRWMTDQAWHLERILKHLAAPSDQERVEESAA